MVVAKAVRLLRGHHDRLLTWFLEQPIVVFGAVLNDLKNVPMFDDFPGIVKSENVDTCIIVAAGPNLVTMKNDKISLGDGPLEVGEFTGVITGHLLEVRNKGLAAVCHMGIVLDVFSTGISLNSIAGLTFVEHEVIEIQCVGLVRFGVHSHFGVLCARDAMLKVRINGRQELYAETLGCELLVSQRPIGARNG
jgi:hypothetical protein